MHLGDASFGDEGDEGNEPSSLGPRAGAAVGVERCTLGMQVLAPRVTKAKSHHRWSRVLERWWVSRDETWESKHILVTRATKAKSQDRKSVLSPHLLTRDRRSMMNNPTSTKSLTSLILVVSFQNTDAAITTLTNPRQKIDDE